MESILLLLLLEMILELLRLAVHAYAAKDGPINSLTDAIEKNVFKFWIEIPLSLGTVGGINKHTSFSKMVFQNYWIIANGKELMKIVAVAGLSTKFCSNQILL